MIWFDWCMVAFALYLTGLFVYVMPQIICEAFSRGPAIPSKNVERVAKLIYMANRRPGPRLGRPTGYLPRAA